MKRFIWIYRPSYVAGLCKQKDGTYIVNYRLGDLRAKMFGIRVPVLWALEYVL